MELALPKEEPISLPDIDATIEARVEATLTAISTPWPEPTGTPSPVSMETPTPAPTRIPTKVTAVRAESLLTGSDEGPMIVKVVAQDGSNMVIVLMTEPVHIRGDIWLDTSGGPTALAEGGGSEVLVFRAGSVAGSVKIRGFGFGRGAALRDIDGNDAGTDFEAIDWSIGNRPIEWASGEDASAPPRVDGISTDGANWRVAFTKPVYVVGEVELETNRGSQELIAKPDRSSATHVLLFGGAPDGIYYDDSTTVEAFRFEQDRQAIRGIDGRMADLDFEPVTVRGFPKSPVRTMADCVHDAYRLSDSAYEGYDGTIDLIRADTIAGADPSTLTDPERFAWFEFFHNQGYRLRQSCIALWSEEITGANAEKRNEDFGEGQRGCIDQLRYWAREELDDDLFEIDIAWIDILGLLERPYLSLTMSERLALRSQIGGMTECRAYYPQLFTGRWVPMYLPDDE